MNTLQLPDMHLDGDHHTQAAKQLIPGRCVVLSGLAGDSTLRTAAAAVRAVPGRHLVILPRNQAIDELIAMLPATARADAVSLTGETIERWLLDRSGKARADAIRALIGNRRVVCTNLDILLYLALGIYTDPATPPDSLHRFLAGAFGTVTAALCEDWGHHQVISLITVLTTLHALRPDLRLLVAGSPLPDDLAPGIARGGLRVDRADTRYTETPGARTAPLAGATRVTIVPAPLLARIEAAPDFLLGLLRDRPAGTYGALLTTSTADTHRLVEWLGPLASSQGLSVALSTRYTTGASAAADLIIGTSLPPRDEALSVLACEAYDGSTLLQRVALAGRSIGGKPAAQAQVIVAVPRYLSDRLFVGAGDAPLLASGEVLGRHTWQTDIIPALVSPVDAATWNARWGFHIPARVAAHLSRKGTSAAGSTAAAAVAAACLGITGVSFHDALRFGSWHFANDRGPAMLQAWSLRGRTALPAVVMMNSGPVITELTTLLSMAQIEPMTLAEAQALLTAPMLPAWRSALRVEPLLFCRIVDYYAHYQAVTIALPSEVSSWTDAPPHPDLGFARGVSGLQIDPGGPVSGLADLNRRVETRQVAIAYKRGIDPFQLRTMYGLPPMFPVHYAVEQDGVTTGSVILGFDALVFDGQIGDWVADKQAQGGAPAPWLERRRNARGY